MTKNEIKQLHEVVKKHDNEEIGVLAIPMKIMNNGVLKPAIEVTVYLKSDDTKKQGFMYRGENSNFDNFLKEAVDALTNEIHREIITQPKPKLSL
jgi:Holliday junction resolvase RusA-like endonuclease